MRFSLLTVGICTFASHSYDNRCLHLLHEIRNKLREEIIDMISATMAASTTGSTLYPKITTHVKEVSQTIFALLLMRKLTQLQ